MMNRSPLRHYFSALGAVVALAWPVTGLAASSPFSSTQQVAGTELNKCGETTLKAYAIFTVGQSALYRPDCQRTWQLDRDEPRYIEFRYQRDLPARAFSESAEVILERNLPLNEREKAELKKFHQAYRPVVDGDVYAILYIPEKGLQLYLNNEQLGELTDPELARHYFSIWLGEEPFDNRVKQELLGR